MNPACLVFPAIRETQERPARRVSRVNLDCQDFPEIPATPERQDLRARKAHKDLRVLMASLLRLRSR